MPKKTLPNLPINTASVQSFVDSNKIFAKTHQHMMAYLKNWYQENPTQFQDDLRADFDTLVKTYHFVNEGLSFSRSYSYKPALDYITCYIRIFDADDDYCAEYSAYYNYELEAFDESLT